MADVVSSGAQPLSFHTIAVYHCLCTFIRECPPSTVVEEGFSSNTASAVLFDAVSYILQRKPWPLARHDAMYTRCADICHTLLNHGADPNANVCIKGASAWQAMLTYATKALQCKDDFQKRFHGSELVKLYSSLLVRFIENDADVNVVVPLSPKQQSPVSKKPMVEYSALKLLDDLFSPPDEGRPEAEALIATSKEKRIRLSTYHRQLISTMKRKGAVDRVWEDGRLVSGPSGAVFPSRESGTLAVTPSSGHHRSSSADGGKARSRRSGLKNLGGLLSAALRSSSQGRL
jgi:hypothetical protein